MERGQKIAFVGANGIGKSTLLKSILGLINPISGKVERGEYQHIGYFNRKLNSPTTTLVLKRSGANSQV